MRCREATTAVDEPLADTTVAIPLKSKRTERKQKRRQDKNKARKQTSLFDIPFELIIDILSCLRPSDVFIVSRVSRSLRNITLQHEAKIAKEIIESRYKALAQCFRLPVLLEKVDEGAHRALQDEERQTLLHIHKKPYQHVLPPDPKVLCTCISCMLAWNCLCVVVDFAGWQNKLDKG